MRPVVVDHFSVNLLEQVHNLQELDYSAVLKHLQELKEEVFLELNKLQVHQHQLQEVLARLHPQQPDLYLDKRHQQEVEAYLEQHQLKVTLEQQLSLLVIVCLGLDQLQLTQAFLVHSQKKMKTRNQAVQDYLVKI